MNFVRLVVLSSALAAGASAADVNGIWKAVFTAPREAWPKTVDKMVFDLKTDGTTVTGIARVGSWPGEAPITDGKIEGDRITFTVTNNRGWTSRIGGQLVASGYPRLTFTGTINGNEMKLTLIWDSIMTSGSAPAPQVWDVESKRKSGDQ